MVGETLYIVSNGSLCSNKNKFIYKEKSFSIAAKLVEHIDAI